MKDLKKTKKPEQKHVDKKSRSEKDRPQSPEELHAAVHDCRLDNRTRQAKELVAARAAIKNAPVDAVRELALDLLSANTIVRNAVLRQMTATSMRLVGPDGEVHPLLKTLWPQLQKEGMAAASLLLRLESAASGKAKADGTDPDQPVDISTLVLELSETNNQ